MLREAVKRAKRSIMSLNAPARPNMPMASPAASIVLAVCWRAVEEGDNLEAKVVVQQLK